MRAVLRVVSSRETVQKRIYVLFFLGHGYVVYLYLGLALPGCDFLPGLFLDEAYALMDSAAGVGGAGDAFSQEALRRGSNGQGISLLEVAPTAGETGKRKSNDSLTAVPPTSQRERERTLLTEVENHRTNLMVVLAGYKALIVTFASSPHFAW